MMLFVNLWPFDNGSETEDSDEDGEEVEDIEVREEEHRDYTTLLGTDESVEDGDFADSRDETEENRFDPVEDPVEESESDSTEFVVEDAGETDISTDDEEDIDADEESDEPRTEDYQSEVVRSLDSGRSSRRHGDSDDAFMELPSHSVTEIEEVDADASAEDLLPDVLPGWNRAKTDTYRWKVEGAEDRINATYIDPSSDRYMVHVSRWRPEHVQYVIDELFGSGESTRFDVWTARGRFVFGVKIAGGTIPQAKTLLTASPALSESYFQLDREDRR